MSDYYDVQQGIDHLKNELKKLASQQEKELKELDADYQKKNSDLYRQMQSLLRERESKAREDFNLEMMELRKQLEQTLQEYVQRHQKEEDKNRKTREALLANLQKTREELDKRLQRMQDLISDQQEKERSKAEEEIEKLAWIEAEVEQKPHQIFFKGNYDIIHKGQEDIREFMSGGMYQAASGQAAMMMTDYELLMARTDQRFREWETLYRYFSTLFQTIQKQVDLFNESRLTTPYGIGIYLSEEEKDYWSQGEYRWMMDYLDENGSFLAEVGVTGILAYLRTQMYMDLDKLTAQYYDLKRQKNHIYAILNCINNERFYSDQRYVWGEGIIQILTKYDYDMIDCHWEKASDEMVEQEWYRKSHGYSGDICENQLGTYHLLFSFGGDDALFVKIMPIRAEGICVRNQCLLMLEMKSSQNDETMQNIIKANRGRIYSVINEEPISCGLSRAIYERTEAAGKKRASVKEQELYLNLLGEEEKHYVW